MFFLILPCTKLWNCVSREVEPLPSSQTLLGPFIVFVVSPMLLQRRGRQYSTPWNPISTCQVATDIKRALGLADAKPGWKTQIFPIQLPREILIEYHQHQMCLFSALIMFSVVICCFGSWKGSIPFFCKQVKLSSCASWGHAICHDLLTKVMFLTYNHLLDFAEYKIPSLQCFCY